MSKEEDDIELRSEEVQEILTKIPHWMIRWGNALFLCLILMLLSISWFVKYPDVVAAEATITTVVPSQKEYSKMTGQVDALLVKSGEIVKENQVLAVIESTANYKDVYRLKDVLDTIHARGTSFEFPIDSIPILELGEIEVAYAVFENNYLQYLINKRFQPLSKEAFSNSYSLSELRSRLVTLEYQKDLSLLELKYKKKDLERSASLFDQGVISEQDYENRKLNHLKAERAFESMRLSISQVQESINNGQKTSRIIEINSIERELTLLRKVIQSFSQLKERIKEWELRYVLKSEIEGTVFFLSHWHKNQQVNQGDLVFTVVPATNSLFVAKLKTPPRNSGKIKPGQKVNIKLENYPETEFGVLIGRVQNISAISNEDGRYLVETELPRGLTTSYRKDLEFKQEMNGIAEIVTQDLRLAERFFYRFKEIVDFK